jgi:hypothetical protein
MARWFIGFLPLALVAACGDDSNNEDPLAKASGFCDAWAEKACNTDVVDSCSQKPNRDSCLESQAAFCRTKVKASKYNKDGARECLKAVEKAYADAKITAEEYQVVHNLDIPCDQVKGASGVFCKDDEDCDDPDSQFCQPREGSSLGVCVINGGFSCKDAELSCAQNFYCNGEDCVSLKNSGGECADSSQCKPEYECVVPEDAETGECKLRLDVGDECEKDADCQTHLCWDGECANRIILSDGDALCEDLS